MGIGGCPFPPQDWEGTMGEQGTVCGGPFVNVSDAVREPTCFQKPIWRAQEPQNISTTPSSPNLSVGATPTPRKQVQPLVQGMNWGRDWTCQGGGVSPCAPLRLAPPFEAVLPVTSRPSLQAGSPAGTLPQLSLCCAHVMLWLGKHLALGSRPSE